MRRLAGIFIACACLLAAQTDHVRFWQDTVTFPTYKEGPPDAIPPFDQFALIGAGVHSIYPYTIRLNMTNERYDAPWRVLHLENQYLHCLILPDLGGHLYTCRDKLSGKDMFYANTAIKKSDVAPRGAWVAGGIETSFPIAHSRVTVSPVHFATTQNDDGSATVYVGAVDRISGMQWRVGYTLRPGSAVLRQQTWLYNPGPKRQPYQWWSNAAMRLPEGGLQFTYPMWVTAPHGAGVLEPWPVDSGGVDRSRSDNYAEDMGVFAYDSREPFFAGYNPQLRTGVSHWADPHEVPGKKIWVYGKSDRGYKDNLSDDHSGYAEIQSGLATTQDMMEFLGPQQSRQFSELWIPSRDTAGISRATPAAVLYLRRTAQAGGAVKAGIDLNVTSVFPHARLTLTKGGATVLQQTVDLDPATTLHAESNAVDAAGKFRFELKDAAGTILLVHQEDTYDAATPAEVKVGVPLADPGAKDALARAEDDELARFIDRAAGEYDEALKGSSKNDSAAQKAAGLFYLGLHRLTEAAGMLEPLHRQNPGDAEVAYYLAVAKSESGDDAGARPLWEATVQDPHFGIAAQDRLACALARAGRLKEAAGMLHQIAARGPGRAAGLEVALLRRMGQTDDAKAALRKALAADPVDSLLRVEGTMLGRDDAAIWSHLAADPEWVLDVADEYLDAGLYREAVALLDRKYPPVGALQSEPGAVLPQDYPLVAYYRGYARQHLGQSAAEDFRTAAAQSTLYVHPYRASSYAVLRAAVEQNPADGTAHYLLGCLLFNSRATDRALAEWNIAKGSGPRIPAFYETVTRVLTRVKQDDRQAESLIDEGLAARPGDAALTTLLASIRNGSAAAGGGPLPSQQVFNSPFDAADYALTMLANHNLAGARAVFETKSLRDGDQPPVQQAYAEVSLQSLLASARSGSCDDVAARIPNFAPDATKQLRMQFYFGFAEWLCGDREAAQSTWTAVSKSKVPASSIDFAFPVLAASLTDPAGSQRMVETALETVRSGGGSPDRGLRLYVEGMLLRAAGREAEALAKFKEGAAAVSIYIRYLNATAQTDPPLPR